MVDQLSWLEIVTITLMFGVPMAISFVGIICWALKEPKLPFQCPEDNFDRVMDELNTIMDERKGDAMTVIPEDKNLRSYQVEYTVVVKVKATDETKAIELASDLVIATIVGERDTNCFASSFVMDNVNEG